jgi:hypothetical protein
MLKDQVCLALQYPKRFAAICARPVAKVMRMPPIEARFIAKLWIWLNRRTTIPSPQDPVWICYSFHIA